MMTELGSGRGMKFKSPSSVYLSTICTDISYGYTASAEKVKIGPKFLRITDIQGGVVSWTTVPYCQIEKIQESKYRLEDGDIVVARTGNSTGENYIFTGHENVVFASYLIRFRVNKEIAHPHFVWYHMRSVAWWNFVNSAKTGSAQAGANAKVLGKFELTLPPLTEQIAIASFLQKIDNRITLLRETNTTLDAIAQALFKSWFIDFDPVHAKAEGREPEGMDAETAALFPDSFEESGLGLIPKEWSIAKIEQVLELAYGKALKATDRIFGSVPVYGSGGVTGYHNEALINEPSVIVGRKGTVGSLYWEDQPFFPIDTVFYVKAKVSLIYCYYLLQTLGLTEMNTDGAVPGLNRSNVYRLQIAKSSNEIIQAFDDVVMPIRKKISYNLKQINTLIKLRDNLLPHLISGEFLLTESEKALKEYV